MYSTEGLHRRPATSKYDQVFGDNSANTRPKDDEIRLLESLLNQRSNLPKPKNSSGFIDGLFGLIPVVILAMIMLFFLFAVLTVIKAFMATQGNDGNASH
ncbi:hypothetical protein HDE_05001 [Halotydeus destructor]|nr:hypothetical protein HDE_05001 [Halotydeus destructor]